MLDNMVTWKTVRMLATIPSKLLLELLGNLPLKSWIPRSAAMKTERERSRSRAVMLVIESVRDLTSLLIWLQYLKTQNYLLPLDIFTSPCHLEHSEKTNTAKNWESKWWCHSQFCQNHLGNQKSHSQFWIFPQYLHQTGDNNKEVKPIEETVKIQPMSKGKDLQQQFQSEKDDENNVGHILQKRRVKVRKKWEVMTWKVVSQTGWP